MKNSQEERTIRTIRGNGRGWVFSAKDFAHLGGRSATDMTLSRLASKGTIRRIGRGLYDYPRHSALLGELSPDIWLAADALARKFGWRIQITGATALNFIGLSNQVPGHVAFISDGPDRTYTIGSQTLEFRHEALKDTGFGLQESEIIVQALKSIGEPYTSPEIFNSLRKWLDPRKRKRVVTETRSVSSWVHDAIMKICQEEISSH